MDKVNRCLIYQMIYLEVAISGVSIQIPMGMAIEPQMA